MAKLSWDKAGKRWKKIYKGKPFYGKRGVKKSDDNAYRLAVDDFENWRKEIDKQSDADKPYRKEYELAIALRQDMANWCLLELGKDEKQWEGQYNNLVKEIEALNFNFSKVNPPPLNKAGVMPINPLHLRPANEVIEWEERIDALRQYRKWTGATDKSKTIKGNIEAHYTSRLKDAHNGKIAPARYSNIVNWLDIFKNWAGEMSIEQLGGGHLKLFQQHLEKKVRDKEQGIEGGFSSSYAHSILNEVKTFVRWLDDEGIIALALT